MKTLAAALTYAVAYIDAVPRNNDDDEDNDCSALESLAAILTECSAEERQAIQIAANDAITSLSAAPSPNFRLIEAYRACIENFCQADQ